MGHTRFILPNIYGIIKLKFIKAFNLDEFSRQNYFSII